MDQVFIVRKNGHYTVVCAEIRLANFLRIEMRFSGVRPVTRCSEAIELEISALEQDPIILPPAILFTTQDFDINLKF